MKKITFLILFFSLSILSYSQQGSEFLHGAWKWVSLRSYSDGKLKSDFFPGIYQGGSVKIWANNYVNDVGRFKNDTSIINLYSGGTYKLEGNRYEETVQYHWTKKGEMTNTWKSLLELRNDTLILTNGVDDNWKLKKAYSVYKFVRLK